MKDNIEAFNEYIELAKRDYIYLETEQNWDADYWKGKGAFLAAREDVNLPFIIVNKSKYQSSMIIDDRDYINWMKAVATRGATERITGSTIFRYLGFQKHLFFSLREVKAKTHPMFIDDQVLIDLEKRLTDLNYSDTKKLMEKILALVLELKHRGIIALGITYDHQHLLRRIDSKQKSLNQRRLNDTAIDDTELDGEEKCISIDAMYSFIWLSQNNKLKKRERFGILIYLIQFAAGLRVGELLRLKFDSLTHQYAINHMTGGPVFDEDGKAVIFWGLEYYPEKGAMTRYKWFDKTTAPLVIASFKEVIEITKECREQLLHIERSPETPIRWPDETMSFWDIHENFISFPEKYLNDSPDSRFKSRLKEVGIYPVKRVMDEARYDMKGRKGNKPKMHLYRVDDLNRYFFEREKNIQSEIEFNMAGETIRVKKSELLFIGPKNVLGTGEFSWHEYLYPDALNRHQVNTFFGCGLSGTRNLDSSIFNRYNLTEADGSAIEIQSHLPRHQLHSFLTIAGVTEHQKAIIMGRNDIGQNEYYDHLSLDDKTRFQLPTSESVNAIDSLKKKAERKNVLVIEESSSLLTEMGEVPSKLEIQQNLHAFNNIGEQAQFLSDALEENTLLSDLQDTYNEIKEEDGLLAAKQFIDVHGRHFNLVVNGSCNRDIAIHGCYKKLRCLQDGGCSHLTITGRPGELESIEKTYKSISENVSKMDVLVKSGELSTRHELQQVDKEKYNLSQLATVLGKARNFKGINPIPVFESGLRLNHIEGKDTVIARFAEAQRKIEGKNNG